VVPRCLVLARRDGPRRQEQRHTDTGGLAVTAREPHQPADLDTAGADTILVINELVLAGIGWHTSADALLANTAAARAREHRATVREELTTANYQ
jgi:hypothetical protein